MAAPDSPTATGSRRSERRSETTRTTWLAAALILVCGAAAYSNSFTDLYVGLDGKESIRDNVHIRHLWPLSEALSLSTWERPDLVHEIPTVANRPTLSLSLALTRHFGGPGAKAQHAVNLAIHIAAALALFGLVRRTLAYQQAIPLSAESVTAIALAGSLVWLLHPLQTQSVTYIIQRGESLMGLLLLVTMYCGVRAREETHRRRWQALAVLACFVGTGAKQTAALAPLLLLAWDHTFVPTAAPHRWRPAFYLAIALPSWALLQTMTSKVAANLDLDRMLEFAVQQPRVILHYLRLTLWPDELYLYVNTKLFAVASAADVVPHALLLVALVGATIAALWRRHWLGFPGAWFFVTLAPSSTILPIPDSIQEYRMYVPLAALAVLAVIAGRALLAQATATFLDERPRRIAGLVLLSLVLLGLGARTHARNRDYHREFGAMHPADLHENYRILADHALSRDDILDLEASLARATLARPDTDLRERPWAHFILGMAHARAGRLDDAAAELRRVIVLDPGFAYAHHQLGVVLRDAGDTAGAVRHLEEAIRLEPAAVHAHKDLAVLLKESGDPGAARARLEAALQIQPGFAEAHYELGIMDLDRDDRHAAAGHFRSAIRDRPDFAEALLELGMLLAHDGDAAAARESLEESVRWDPELADARYELGRVLVELGEPAAAVGQFRAAVQLRPEFAEAQQELGVALAAAGDSTGAVAELEQALRLDPGLADAHAMLGVVLRSRADFAGAARHFEAALRLDPANAEAARMLADVRARQDSAD
jgi:tetratricopeptide (TPR) repeat protein